MPTRRSGTVPSVQRNSDIDQMNRRASRIHDAMHLLPAIIWMVLIFALSARQWAFGRAGDLEPGMSRAETSWYDWSTRFEWSWSPLALLGRAAHITEYAVLAALLYWGFRRVTRRHPRAASLALAVTALYGITDEIHQSFVPGRTPSVPDLLIDLIGAALALLAIEVWLARTGR